MQLQIERLAANRAPHSKLVLRGLFFAIVDEADSVLVDEARTPLDHLGQFGSGARARDVRSTRSSLAEALEVRHDFRIHDRDASCRAHRRRQAASSRDLPRACRDCFAASGAAKSSSRRRCGAVHLFKRDTHYLVRDGQIQIIDEFTGRIMADRSWEAGLHQMMEAKEGCPLSEPADFGRAHHYQRFFRRYLRLAGMTGTPREVAGELWSVYRLPVVRVPTNRPVQRRYLDLDVHATAAEKWRGDRRAHCAAARRGAAGARRNALGRRIGAAQRPAQARGHPAPAAQCAAGQRGSRHRRAGRSAGRITVATNMAGRGTDIAFGEGVAERGGLHVIATELHESAASIGNCSGAARARATRAWRKRSYRSRTS